MTLNSKHVSVVIAFLVFTGCGLPFSRPMPSESEYKKKFLASFQSDEIKELRFSYHGSVGGAASIARFKVDANTITRIRTVAMEEKEYVPSDAKFIQEFKKKLSARFGKQLPEWFDFPFDKVLAVFSERNSKENPPHYYQWFVDEDTNVVFFVATQG